MRMKTFEEAIAMLVRIKVAGRGGLSPIEIDTVSSIYEVSYGEVLAAVEKVYLSGAAQTKNVAGEVN